MSLRTADRVRPGHFISRDVGHFRPSEVHEAPANSRGPPGIRLFLIIPTPAKHSLILIRHKLSSIFNMYNTLTLQHFLDTQADTSIFHTKQNDIILHYKTNS
jgi:hypothetical protein